MPLLSSYVDPSLDAPGFLLPLFRRDTGANIGLAQVIDHQDCVQGFMEIAAPGRLLCPARTSVAIEVGEAALWAFKDHENEIHVGTALEMRSIASILLSGQGLLP